MKPKKLTSASAPEGSKFAPPVHAVSRETKIVAAAIESIEAKASAEAAPLSEARAELVAVISDRAGATLAPDIQLIPVEAIVANPYQPRKTFSDAELDELVDSIAEHGILQAPAVRPAGDEWFVEPGATSGKPCFFVLNQAWHRPNPRTLEMEYKNRDGMNVPFGFAFTTREEAEATIPRFEIIGGERRVRAVRRLNKRRIEAGEAPIRFIGCNVRPTTDREMAELAIMENAQRSDVSAIEEARAMRRLIDEFGATNKELKDKAGVSHSKISNRLRLLDLPDSVQAMIGADLSESHGVILAGLKDLPVPFIEWYAAKIVREKIPSKTLEKGIQLDYQDAPELRKANLAARMDYRDYDWEAAQAAHPNLFRKIGYQYWCFDVALHKRLTAEGKAAEKAEEEAKAQALAAAAGDANFVDATTLKGNYRPIGEAPDSWNFPAKACTGACPCRKTCKGNDNKLREICIDTERFEALKEAQERAQAKTRKAAIDAVLDEAAPHLGGQWADIARWSCSGSIVRAKRDVLTRAALALDIELDVAKFLDEKSGLAQLVMLDAISVEKIMALSALMVLYSRFYEQAASQYKADLSAPSYLLGLLPEGKRLNAEIEKALNLAAGEIEEFDTSEGANDETEADS